MERHESNGNLIDELNEDAFRQIQALLHKASPDSELERHEIYKNSIIPLLPSLSEGEIDLVAPEIEKKIGIKRASLRRDIKKNGSRIAKNRRGEEGDVHQSKPELWPHGNIHPAMHFDLVSGFASVEVIRSEGMGLVWYHPSKGAEWAPLDSVRDFITPIPFSYHELSGRWPEADLKEFLEHPSAPSFAEPARLLIELIQKYVEMPKQEYVVLESLWIIGTYFYQVFSSYPRLHHNGEPGSGKTKIQRVISKTSFNGLLRINLTLAVLFRIIDAHRPTLCLDEMDNLGQDGRQELLSLINSGYQQGGAIDRVEGDSNDRHVVSYGVFSPISISGVKELHGTTATRCIFVPMQRGSNPKTLNSDVLTDVPKLENIRSLCYRLGLLRAGEVAHEFRSLQTPKWLNGRDRELWAPLLAIAVLIDREEQELNKPSTFEALIRLAESLVAEQETISPESEAVLFLLEKQIGDKNTIEIRPKDLCDALEEILRRKFTPEAAAGILRRLGFDKLPHNRWGSRYQVTRRKMNEIMTRYGPKK